VGRIAQVKTTGFLLGVCEPAIRPAWPMAMGNIWFTDTTATLGWLAATDHGTNLLSHVLVWPAPYAAAAKWKLRRSISSRGGRLIVGGYGRHCFLLVNDGVHGYLHAGDWKPRDR